MRSRRLILVALLSSVVACGSSSGDGVDAAPAMMAAPGVTITSVAFYQSVERMLFADGAQQSSNIPLVAGRPGMLRVFYTAAAEQHNQSVIVRLHIDGADTIETESLMVEASNQGQLDTTINVAVPGELISGSFSYRVELLQPGTGGDNPGSRHPIDGFEQHSVDVQPNTLRLVLVPFQYNADGSGRLPNTSPEAVELYRQRFMQLYPVSDVDVIVRDPVPWSTAIDASGGGWQEVAFQVFNLRDSDGMGEDVYYYGIFNPTDTFGQFCAGGCLLGVTLLNDDPTDVGNPSLRLAIGVGFDEVATDTSAHELGHAHGRAHAPCGRGLDPQSIDPQYPHAAGSVGVWGWDMFSNTLVNPANTTDIMGYCDDQWISDYNFIALANRGKNVNLAQWSPGPGSYRVVTFDARLKATVRGTVPADRFTGPPTTPIELTTDRGTRTVMGYAFQYDHLPGGWLLYPEQPNTSVIRIGATLDGRLLRVGLKR